MVCFSPERCTCRWQFNQYRHTLSVFLSGVRAADSGIAGVGGHGGAGGAVEVAVVAWRLVASPAQPVPLTSALWSDSPEPSASLIGSQSRVNHRSVSAGSIFRNRCSSHHFRPPGMEPPARAATCVCCLSFPCAAAIALLLTSAPLHAGRCCTRCWNPALVARSRQMPSHHRQRRKASHKATVQTGPQPCAQVLARQVGDSTQRRSASPPNHSRGPRAGIAGGAHIGRPHSTVPQRQRAACVCVLLSLHSGPLLVPPSRFRSSLHVNRGDGVFRAFLAWKLWAAVCAHLVRGSRAPCVCSVLCVVCRLAVCRFRWVLCAARYVFLQRTFTPWGARVGALGGQYGRRSTPRQLRVHRSTPRQLRV